MTDWQTYLTKFHDARPGITEDLLVHCRDNSGATPYDWLVEAVPTGRGLVVELACGSSPLRPLLATRYVLGVDRSHGELHRSASRGARIVCAEARSLPVPDTSVAVVAASMALMLMARLDEVLVEIARVLRPGGLLVATVPSATPLSARDLWTYGRLLRALRIRGLGYPDAVENLGARLGNAGLTLREDCRRRFVFSASTVGHADLFIRSLYLPGVADSAIEGSRRMLHDAVSSGSGLELGIPLRRLVARRD